MEMSKVVITPESLGGVLEAIELDLRATVVTYLDGDADPQSILGNTLWERCRERFEKERGYFDSGLPLQTLVPYLDFGDLFQLLNAHGLSLPGPVVKHVRAATPHLAKLVQIRNRVAHNRPLLYDDCAIAKETATYLISASSAMWPHLDEALKELVNHAPAASKAVLNNLPVPDYEETGYIGRQKQVEDLERSVLYGAYPVTVFGDGGIGKTAIALKVAYNILESPDCPFDAIVWTSSKTQQLTPHEIARIKDAIADSLGLFREVSHFLGASSTANPIEEVLTYLAQFRILLILDNLETVLDDIIRDFLRNLPRGSKILITSRIGIGAYDDPFRLQALDEGNSIQLLRSLATIRQVPELIRVSDKQLRRYCAAMKNNPLFIKWFVSAVQAGVRPEQVLDQRDLFLEFCMSNVYEYLLPASRKILNSLLCLPGKHSLAELAFLNDMDALDLEPAIRQLRTTTMVTLYSSIHESTFESKYGLSELARDYLAKYHPVKPDEQQHYRKRQQQLVSATEQMSALRESDPYNFFSIARRSESDVIVAKYLFEALNKWNKGNYKEALDLVKHARDLAPQYFEVHRVEAIIRVAQGDYTAAQAAYETAIELNPASAPLRVWFGGFCLRYLQDITEAAKQFWEAAKLDPNAWQVKLEVARVTLRLRKFSEAAKEIEALMGSNVLMKPKERRMVHDMSLQLEVRRADHMVSERDWLGALEALEHLRDVYDAVPQNVVDKTMKSRLRKAIYTAQSCVNALLDPDARQRAELVLDWLYDVSKVSEENGAPLDWDQCLHGEVTNLIRKGAYGFIQPEEEGPDYFFRRADLYSPQEWNAVDIGSKVIFWKAQDGERPRAANVILDDDFETETPSAE